jgi:DNA-binding SARP family transcriptional activator
VAVQPQIALRMLGSFDLRVSGELVALAPSVERVVAYVALHQGPTTRLKVAGSLWLDVPEDRAMANLRSALWRLRRPGVPVLEARGESLSLSPHVHVDTQDLVATAHAVMDGAATMASGDLHQLASSHDLLGDWYEDWVVVEREHIRQLRLQALELVAADFAHRGQFGRAIEIALAAVASEPLRESAHRVLITAHLAQGNRSEAIRQYVVYQRLMREELDLEPSPQMHALIDGAIPATAMTRATGPLITR